MKIGLRTKIYFFPVCLVIMFLQESREVQLSPNCLHSACLPACIKLEIKQSRPQLKLKLSVFEAELGNIKDTRAYMILSISLKIVSTYIYIFNSLKMSVLSWRVPYIAYRLIRVDLLCLVIKVRLITLSYSCFSS